VRAVVGVSAHRGGDEVAAEGTLAAYRAAIALGVDLLELDVRRRPDGIYVCSHDPLPGDPADPGDAPLLGEVLRAAAAAGVGAQIDVKEAGYEPALVAFVSGHALPRAFYTTGDPAVIRRITDAGGTALLTVGAGLAGLPPHQVVRRIAGDLWPNRRLRGHAGAAVQFRFVNPLLRRWLAQRGMHLLVYTVDGPASLWWLLRRRGVTAVITDRPQRALSLRARSKVHPAAGRDEDPPPRT
jgi:glycerophosphoryl diester phosphodiesterase